MQSIFGISFEGQSLIKGIMWGYTANSGRVLRITGINYSPSPSLLWPVSVPTFGNVLLPPFLSMLIRARWRGGTRQDGWLSTRQCEVKDPSLSTPSPTLLFFFFKEKSYLNSSDMIDCSNSTFYPLHINTTLICEPDSHPYLLNGGNLDLKNICCAVSSDLGRLGIFRLESQPAET